MNCTSPILQLNIRTLSRPPILDYYCAHKILDAVLAFYLELAKRNSIRVTTKLIFLVILPVNKTDLATALANALEKAIHTCEKLENPNRYIAVKSTKHPHYALSVKQH